MKILVPGGAGYIGAQLVPFLLADGHEVTVLDTQWFGSGHLPDNPKCHSVKGDVRDWGSYRDLARGQEAVIWLAGITNNDMCMKNPELSKSVNIDCFRPCVEISMEEEVGLFVYASSVAAYGSSEKVMEETDSLNPETPYAEAKVICEEILETFQSDTFTTVITRSASVCGPSMNMRHDITVNRMVHDGREGVVTVNGGSQFRCHIHMEDIVNFYRWILQAPEESIAGETFNVVDVNEHVMETAMLVCRTLSNRPRIEVKIATDSRSYRVSPTKMNRAGFYVKKPIEHAIRMIEARTWRDEKENWRML